MPNFKIFQDNPDYARIKIFGGNNVALNTDATGSLSITSTGLAITPPTDGLAITSTGLAITPPADGLAITSTGLAITPPADGLTITSTGLAITPPADGLAITSTGLAITPPADGLTITSTGLAITPPANGLLITAAGLNVVTGTTDVSYVIANNNDTDGGPDVTRDVLGVSAWTYGVVNESLAANAQALVKLQTSPDGVYWQDEVANITINQNSLATFVATVFLKYARLYYSAVDSNSAVTLNIFFQGQL